MSWDCVTPYTASELASKDSNRLLGSIAKALAANSPFVNVLDGGIFPAGVSDQVRSVVQEQSNPGDSLVQPTFADNVNIDTGNTNTCVPGTVAESTATTEFTYKLQNKRGRGPKICVKGAYAAFKGSYLMAEDALKKLMTQYFNSDVRYTLMSRSGIKYTAGNSGTISFEGGLSVSSTLIDATWANVNSNNIGQLTFKALHKLARYLHEVQLVEMWEDGTAGMHYKFIGSSDIVESFRAELGVKEVLIAQTTGGFKFGEQALRGYSWESNVAYRGITFGVDQRPLRALDVTAGAPTSHFVEPLTGVSTTKGTAGRVNPTWVAAPYEVAFLIGKGSFERLVPERFTGEGSFKFSPQLAMGELQWHYVIDNECNQYGDFGWHLYEIQRAYRPVRPQFVCPILYRRCPFDTGITSCTATGSLL